MSPSSSYAFVVPNGGPDPRRSSALGRGVDLLALPMVVLQVTTSNCCGSTARMATMDFADLSRQARYENEPVNPGNLNRHGTAQILDLRPSCKLRAGKLTEQQLRSVVTSGCLITPNNQV